MRCTIHGKAGWKFGLNGTCYAGPAGKEKAAQQGRAIEASKAKHGYKYKDK